MGDVPLGHIVQTPTLMHAECTPSTNRHDGDDDSHVDAVDPVADGAEGPVASDVVEQHHLEHRWLVRTNRRQRGLTPSALRK